MWNWSLWILFTVKDTIMASEKDAIVPKSPSSPESPSLSRNAALYHDSSQSPQSVSCSRMQYVQCFLIIYQFIHLGYLFICLFFDWSVVLSSDYIYKIVAELTYFMILCKGLLCCYCCFFWFVSALSCMLMCVKSASKQRSHFLLVSYKAALYQTGLCLYLFNR